MLNKAKATTADQGDPSFNALDRRYRPRTLDRVIGHEHAITRLNGIIKTGKFPSAIGLFGPTSAGKTTIGRAFATTTNGKPVERQSDFRELNCATTKGIDDIRELERLSKFSSLSKKRFIMIDEAHQILTNRQAAQALLKPLEEPSRDTVWILASMEPAAFKGSDVGLAILNRLQQFVLKAPGEDELMKYALRIVKGEQMTYVMDKERTLLGSVVQASAGQMRQVAHILHGLQQYWEGLDEKPKRLSTKDVSVVIDSAFEGDDEQLLLDVLAGLFAKDFRIVQRGLMDVQDPFGFLKKLGWATTFLMNASLVKGKHPAVLWMPSNRKAHEQFKRESFEVRAALAAAIARVQAQALTSGQPLNALLSSELYYVIQGLK